MRNSEKKAILKALELGREALQKEYRIRYEGYQERRYPTVFDGKRLESKELDKEAKELYAYTDKLLAIDRAIGILSREKMSRKMQIGLWRWRNKLDKYCPPGITC